MLQDQLGKLFTLSQRALCPGWVLQVVEYQQLCAWCDLFLDGVHVQLEVFFPLNVAVWYGLAALELNLGLVNRIARIGVKHLVTRVHQGQKEFIDSWLAPWLDGYVLHAVADAAGGADVSGQGLAQLWDAGVRAVAGLPVLHGLYGSLDDVGRRDYVHVTQVKRIHFVALSSEGSGLS